MHSADYYLLHIGSVISVVMDIIWQLLEPYYRVRKCPLFIGLVSLILYY